MYALDRVYGADGRVFTPRRNADVMIDAVSGQGTAWLLKPTPTALATARVSRTTGERVGLTGRQRNGIAWPVRMVTAALALRPGTRFRAAPWEGGSAAAVPVRIGRRR